MAPPNAEASTTTAVHIISIANSAPTEAPAEMLST